MRTIIDNEITKGQQFYSKDALDMQSDYDINKLARMSKAGNTYLRAAYTLECHDVKN